MKKITVVEPLPWNGLMGLYLEFEPSREPEATLTIDEDGEKKEIELDESDIRKMIKDLQQVLDGKEVVNG